jgi:Cellobiohydrolase A (1,4-beta-cellobiosidase A)
MHKTRRTILLVGLAALALGLLPVLAGAGACNSRSTFYVPKADTGATQQIVSLIRHHNFKDAALLQKMVSKGHAVWFSGGTPSEVRKAVKKTMPVKKTMRQARAKHAVPVLVAYNLPYRDCGQYSKGGALNTAAYKAWIDGFAAGIGSSDAVVILEPDGLGLIPNYVSELDGSQNCKISGPEATPAARFEQLNYAVDVLTALPNTAVYLDATHSGWQNVSETAFRLLKVDVEQTDGFFLNVSNYQYTSNEVMYGTWVSSCIAKATSSPSWTGDPVGPLGSGFPNCPNQYWNGGPPSYNNGVALSPYGEWSDTATEWDLNTSNITLSYAAYPAATTHFVIDTGRNGLGPWDYRSKYATAAIAQDWCNPPGRGLGIAPTTNTGNALVDAYLWVKVPGESDGSCNRSVAGSTTDPEWGGIVDPAAGAWFPQQALQLAQLANPALH